MDPEKLKRYIESLNLRRQGIVDNLSKFFELIFPHRKGELTAAEKIRLLNEQNKKNPFIDFKMQGEVQSYDLLQNDKYGRLDELKNALDNSVKTTSGTKAAPSNRV